MGITGDAAILRALLRGQPKGVSHAERLNRFYGPQAARYDSFRERLLQGRGELLDTLATLAPARARLLEMGAGTGRNLAFLGKRISQFEHIELVDLCAPLLGEARKRWANTPGVTVTEADATCYRPTEPLDAVYFSYALSMIPNWFSAMDNALAMLKPGGLLGVADFYVSRRHPAPGLIRHGGLTRLFWPAWFAHDGVHPSPDHLPYLQSRLETVLLEERRAKVPYLPIARVPYYVFVGRKAAD